jgi:TonB family protein
VQKGTAAAETGVTGQAQGLTVGGGGGAAAVLPADFCCLDYANEVLGLIKKQWNQSSTVAGETTITFTIYRDGTLSDPIVSKSSGNSLLDIQSRAAVRQVKKLPPLPGAYTNNSLTIHLVFPYTR